ncbi:RluA family pseudouridine synthase [Eubacteriales bacterium KG127]
MAKFTYIIKKEDEELQIKQLIRTKFHFSSRLMGKIKRANLVYLNDKEVLGWQKGSEGDKITIMLPDEKSNFEPENIPLNVVYEDNDLLIINKQNGVTVHPTRGCPNHTIANGIMKHMIDKKESYKIRFINRLDTDTSGLLIVGKNSYVQNEITKQMKSGTINKSYIALVNGLISDDEFMIDKPIGRLSQEEIRRGFLPVDQGGSESRTLVKVLERIPPSQPYPMGFTLAQLTLLTGRTHQIRVHMSSIGHILVGDWLYGDTNQELIPRQALHAFKLEFTHPVTGQDLILKSNLPEDITKLIEKLKYNMENFNFK